MGVAVAGLCASACAQHGVRPAFRSAIVVDERGIFVPLPPPSFTAAPIQNVQLRAEIVGLDPIEVGTIAYVVDERGPAEVEVLLEEDAVTFSAELEIDLRDHCLQAWLVAPDGAVSEIHRVHAEVIDDRELETLAGCPDAS